MKKQLIYLFLISVVLFFPIVPVFCFMMRDAQGVINFMTIFFATGFGIGYFKKVSDLSKLLMVTLPLQCLMLFAIYADFYLPSWEVESMLLLEYTLTAPLWCYLGMYAQREMQAKQYKKVAYSLVLPALLGALSVWKMTDYQYYMYYNKRVADRKIPASLQLRTVDNQILTEKHWEGKVVFLDFWDTHCGYCLDLMKDLKQIKQKYEGNPNVLFLSVNVAKKDSFEAFLKSVHVKRFGKDLDLLYDESKKMADALNISTVPHVFLLDKKGNIKKYFSGYGGDYVNFTKNMVLDIDKLLNE